jgi:hypothetical protein
VSAQRKPAAQQALLSGCCRIGPAFVNKHNVLRGEVGTNSRVTTPLMVWWFPNATVDLIWTALLLDNIRHECPVGAMRNHRHLFPTNPKVGLAAPAVRPELRRIELPEGDLVRPSWRRFFLPDLEHAPQPSRRGICTMGSVDGIVFKRLGWRARRPITVMAGD